MELKLYRFTLPLATNAGLSTEKARKDWEQEALKLAGGFTLLPFADGAWRDDTGRTMKDRVALYEVGCAPKIGLALADCFWRLFPDQEALFIAQLGTASNTLRPPIWQDPQPHAVAAE